MSPPRSFRLRFGTECRIGYPKRRPAMAGSCAISATERQITTPEGLLCNAIFRLGLGASLKVLLCFGRWLRLAQGSGFSDMDDLCGCRSFAMNRRYLGKAP